MSRLIAIFAFAAFVVSVSSIPVPENALVNLGSSVGDIKSYANSIARSLKNSAANARSESGDRSVALSNAKAKNNGLANAAAKANDESIANAEAKADGLKKDHKKIPAAIVTHAPKVAGSHPSADSTSTRANHPSADSTSTRANNDEVTYGTTQTPIAPPLEAVSQPPSDPTLTSSSGNEVNHRAAQPPIAPPLEVTGNVGTEQPIPVK